MPPPPKIFKGLLKLIGPFLFIFLFIKVVDLKQVTLLIKDIRVDVLIASVLLIPVSNAILSLRWWVICTRLNMGVSFKTLFQIYYVSWFLSALPFVGISPLAKVIYLKEDAKSTGVSLVSIVLDKIFDVIGLIFFGLFGILYFPRLLFKDFRVWLIVFAICFVVLNLWLFGKALWKTFLKFIKRYTGKRIQRIGKELETDMNLFWSGFGLAAFTKILTISIVLGLSRAAVLYILALSLKIQVNFIFILACRALIGVVNVVPISINGLGTRDAILLLMFSILGISGEAAIALGLLSFLWIIISKFTGIIFWLKRPLPFSSIMSMKEKFSP